VPATASIAESGSLAVILDNADEGIDVEPDGSLAAIDETNLVSLGNGD